MSDTAYERGSLAALRSILGHVLRERGAEGDAARWAVERADIVLALRALCEEYGDNDWDDKMHLGDVIRKHLEPYL